ncbi:class I SAM-dependent methyltransferase [Myxococcaceae bacterium GXIMD 01537]
MSGEAAAQRGAASNPRAREQEEACRSALESFERAAPGFGARRQGWLRYRLHVFLQFLTVRTDFTVNDVPADVVAGWLEPARGLWEHDLRVDLLEVLAGLCGNPALRQPRQEGSAGVRMAREHLLWREHQRELWRRTRPYFEDITQQGILDDEKRSEPFYAALHAAYPTAEEVGSFAESDEEIVSVLRSRPLPASPPSIVDLGCGGGRLLRRLAREYPGAALVGTSIFQFTPEQAAGLSAHGIRPLYCTANRVDLPDASQDLVVSTEVIEHLRDPEDMVREIARILKPGGAFVVTAPSKAGYMYNPNPTTYLAAALSAVAPAALPPFHDLYAPLTPVRFVHYGFAVDAFERLFRRHFEHVEVHTTRFTSLRKFRLDGVAPRVPLLRKMGGLCMAVGRK